MEPDRFSNMSFFLRAVVILTRFLHQRSQSSASHLHATWENAAEHLGQGLIIPFAWTRMPFRREVIQRGTTQLNLSWLWFMEHQQLQSGTNGKALFSSQSSWGCTSAAPLKTQVMKASQERDISAVRDKETRIPLLAPPSPPPPAPPPPSHHLHSLLLYHLHHPLLHHLLLLHHLSPVLIGLLTMLQKTRRSRSETVFVTVLLRILMFDIFLVFLKFRDKSQNSAVKLKTCNCLGFWHFQMLHLWD